MEFFVNTTPGSVEAYSVTSFTSTVAAMLIPQEQTQTPILGSWPETSVSAGNSLGAAGTKPSPTMWAPAFADAPQDSATVVGMSLGAAKAPLTNIPGLDVARGSRTLVLQYPYSLSSIPRVFASSTPPTGGLRPMERTTRSNSSVRGSPLGPE